MADTIKKEIFTVTLTYEMAVNIDTGEILETRLVSRSVNNSDIKPSPRRVVQDDGDKEPKLVLEENKYRLNNAAVTLMGLDGASKLIIKYEESKSGSVPVIGTNTAFGISSSGNKLTKSNTVACRGSNHDELSKHGTEFILVPHPNKDGLFILTSGNKDIKLIGDENVEVNEEEVNDIPFSLDMEGLVDDKDANITEVDSNFFQL